MVRASIVIVEYASRAHLPACLDSIAATEFPPDELEVVVVDNGSPTPVGDLAGRYPRVRFLETGQNLGFAGGCNAGVHACRGETIVALNPDVTVHPAFLRAILAPLEDESIGIVGCKVYYPDSRVLQHAGGVVYDNAVTEHRGRGQYDVGQYDDLEDVEYVTGAALAVRRDLLERVGFFSTAYFPAYYEETELCVRARRAAYRVVYAPQAIVYHHEAASSGSSAALTFLRRYHTNRIRYVLRNYSPREIVRRFLPAEVAFHRDPARSREERMVIARAYVDGVMGLLRGAKS